MKKIHISLIAVLSSLLFFASCDVDRYSYEHYTGENIDLNDETTFDYVLVGCYSQLKEWSDVMHRLGEYPADNVMIRGTSSDSFYSFINYAHVKDNGRLTTFWKDSYKIISQSSDLINAREEGQSKEFDQKLGEAYYLRGMTYFYLTRVFGRPYSQSPETNLGVPIVSSGIPEKAENIVAPNRSTVKECYYQAIGDLQKGEKLMKIPGTAAYASKEAAQAMLSRIYLYMSGNYTSPNTVFADSCIYYAEEVIKSNRYELLSTENFKSYNTYAPDSKGQTETIFAVKRVSSEFSGSDYYYGIGGMYASILGQGWGEMYATSKYLDLLNKTGLNKDARWAFISPQYSLDDQGEKIPAFRFITELKNDKGVQTGYTYVQDTLRTKAGGKYYVKLNNKEYDLTEKKEGNDTFYTINYEGKIRTGEKDNLMILNRIYPMFYITKCSLQEGESHLHSPIISRLAELYLNMAEAYAKTNKYTLAAQSLNKVRERSLEGEGYPSMDASNAAILITEERQLELAFEAHRAYDVYRNDETMVRNYPGPHDAMTDIPATSPRVVHYIPQVEIDAYSGPLTQNPD